jgi:hypothetical protein
LLLEQVPELADDFHRMAELSPEWALFVEYWQKICDTMDKEAPRWIQRVGTAPKTYSLMKQLLKTRGRKHEPD